MSALRSAPSAGDRTAAARSLAPALIKVPEVLVWFWLIKITTTALGEAVSDYLVGRFPPVPVVLIGFVGFLAALVWQLRTPTYQAPSYWAAALMVSTFGTMAADVAHVGLGIPYLASTALSTVALAATFLIWFSTEGTLSIHSITTRRRELFYWAAALITFALGTAAGDLAAVTLHLGYLTSGVLFGVAFAVPLLGERMLDWNPIAMFWCAYIATRPFGASFADWFAKPTAKGGLGIGDGLVSLILATILAVGVTLLAKTKVDDPNLTNRAAP